MINFFQKPIAIAFAPNVENDDFWLAIKLFIPTLLERIKNTSIAKLEESFKQYFEAQYAYAFSSGRAALYYILKSLSLDKDDEILIQAFTCIAVPNSVLWAGFKPIYVDINRDSLNMSSTDLEKKITPKSKVVVVQHTFGIPADMKEIKRIALKNNLIIIEDCAHSLGAEYDGRKIGSLSEVAFFSFGRDKVISSVFGGMVITKNPQIAKNLQQFYKNLKKPPVLFVAQQLLYIITYKPLLLFYDLFIGKLLLKTLFSLNILSKAVFKEEKKGNMLKFINYQLSPTLAKLARHQFEKLSRFNNHRRFVARVYTNKLSKIAPEYDNGDVDSKPIYLRFPIFIKNKKDFLKKAARKGIYLGDWYKNPITPEPIDWSFYQYKNGSCPIAEKVCQQIVNLPTHINIKKSEAEQIISIVNDYTENKIDHEY